MRVLFSSFLFFFFFFENKVVFVLWDYRNIPQDHRPPLPPLTRCRWYWARLRLSLKLWWPGLARFFLSFFSN